jgi:pimeloyl-ACP methyl ester carboxylesterase
MKARARRLFRQMAPIMHVLAFFGLSARMSPMQAADVTIEMDQVNGELLADFEAITCPVLFIAGTGAHQGATDEEMRILRAAADLATSKHGNVTMFATVPCNHVKILSRAADTVVAAIDNLAARSTDGPVVPEQSLCS